VSANKGKVSFTTTTEQIVEVVSFQPFNPEIVEVVSFQPFNPEIVEVVSFHPFNPERKKWTVKERFPSQADREREVKNEQEVLTLLDIRTCEVILHQLE
jgi:hypothetical protein